MSRWVVRGLAQGIETTRFPRAEDPAASGAGAALEVDVDALTPERALAAARVCPTAALDGEGDAGRGSLIVDGGHCILCGRCARAVPEAFALTSDPRVAVSRRERLRAGFLWQDGRLERVAPSTVTARAAADLHRASRRAFGRSLHIRHVDAGSCNGCESELQMLSTPHYDLQRLGLFFTPTPRHADALLVTGVVTRRMEPALRTTWEAMPDPKLVVAAGVCAIGGGSFAAAPTAPRTLDQVLPVDVYVPGCPPTPLALLHGLLLAVGRVAEGRGVTRGGDGA